MNNETKKRRRRKRRRNGDLNKKNEKSMTLDKKNCTK
jgi:hypothetical protein